MTQLVKIPLPFTDREKIENEVGQLGMDMLLDGSQAHTFWNPAEELSSSAQGVGSMTLHLKVATSLMPKWQEDGLSASDVCEQVGFHVEEAVPLNVQQSFDVPAGQLYRVAAHPIYAEVVIGDGSVYKPVGVHFAVYDLTGRQEHP